MNKIRITIGNKILLSFILLIFIFIVSGIISIITVNANDQSTDIISEVVDPSKDEIEEMRLLATESKMLITNWVYLQSNAMDKEALRVQHEFEYPEHKTKLLALRDQWKDKSQRELLDSVLINFENLVEVEKGVMSLLVEFEDYEDPILKFAAEDSIESKILPQSAKILEQLDNLSKIKKKEKDRSYRAQQESSKNLVQTIIALAIISIVVGGATAVLISSSITKPINHVRETILLMSKGVLPKEKKIVFSNDEIGEMARAMDNLVTGLNETSNFAKTIGEGNYDAGFEPLSNQDVLGNSLLEMRKNLKSVSEEEKRRSWTTEGLALFGDILRKNVDDMAALTDKVLSTMVKYLAANQGGLFVINEEEEEDNYMELAACYAWDTKKHLEEKVYLGDGLCGQVWLDKEKIYYTDIPDKYVKISSGLGEANPSSLLIVPLKVNDIVYGVIELASFEFYESYQIEFVEKVAESIASTIASVKINQRTQKLLEESTTTTEQMRFQEEQMRQSMEELQATQEEMERSQRERQASESVLDNTQMIVRLDEKFSVIRINEKFKETLHFDRSSVIYKDLSEIVSDAYIDKYSQLKESLNKKASYTGTFKLVDNIGKELVVQIAGGALFDHLKNEKNYVLFISKIDEEVFS